jgi:hypothetical protein
MTMHRVMQLAHGYRPNCSPVPLQDGHKISFSPLQRGQTTGAADDRMRKPFGCVVRRSEPRRLQPSHAGGPPGLNRTQELSVGRQNRCILRRNNDGPAYTLGIRCESEQLTAPPRVPNRACKRSPWGATQLICVGASGGWHLNGLLDRTCHRRNVVALLALCIVAAMRDAV